MLSEDNSGELLHEPDTSIFRPKRYVELMKLVKRALILRCFRYRHEMDHRYTRSLELVPRCLYSSHARCHSKRLMPDRPARFIRAYRGFRPYDIRNVLNCLHCAIAAACEHVDRPERLDKRREAQIRRFCSGNSRSGRLAVADDNQVRRHGSGGR